MLWIGEELSWLEQLCIQSFLDHGHQVVLHAYDKVQNVPDGVQLNDAAQIFPTEKIIRHARTNSPAYHADVFRLHMLRQTDYIWADTDAYCCKPWEIARGKHFHGWISDKTPQVNNGVLRLPKTSKTLKKMLDFTSDEYPIPPWYSEEKQHAMKELKDAGDGVHVSLLPWGVWGPNALTWFLHDTGEIEHSLPGHVIYPVPFKIAGITLNPNRKEKARALVTENTLSIHFWGRRFRNIVSKYDGVPSETSYVAELLKRHKIDPKKTAHMMQATKSVTSSVHGIEDIDFSMFDDADVANMVLQRSEIGPVGQEIRDWIGGDDTAILKYARENRDQVISSVFDIACRECEIFVDSTDKINPSKVADIGCGYAFADLVLYRRYGCDLFLIDIEESNDRHFGFESAGAGYASLAKAKLFLEKNGVPSGKIKLLNPNLERLSDIGQVDLAISLASCGFHYPVATYEDYFRDQISSDGGIVLDIRKGSGGIGFMKTFGSVSILRKHAKYSTVFVEKGASD